MTPQRKEHLYRQYVIPIVNDGEWYRAVKPRIEKGHAANFYNQTILSIDRLASQLGENRPTQEERAYIYLCAWEYHDGIPEAFAAGLNRAGNLYACVDALLCQRYQPVPQPEPEPQKEEPVNPTTPAFETRHFVYGLDVANMSAGQLIEAIKKIEAEIADLKGVKAKSDHIKGRIAELEVMLAKVVVVLDAK